MSIRLRMTLLYSAILALTLFLFSGVLYVSQAQYTLEIVRNDLEMNAAKLVGAWVRFHRDWYVRLPRNAPRDDAYFDAAQQVLQPLIRSTILRDAVHILDRDGMPLALPVNEQSESLPISDEGMAQLRQGTASMEISQGEQSRWLVYNLPVILEDDVIGIVQLARPLADRDRSLQSLGLMLLAGSGLTILAAFGAGWILAGTTLRPIQRITQTAQAIGDARDFGSRVAYRGPKDELGRLATTFNAMLSRLQAAYEQITHALQVQRDFVADVSHELRTPLTTIRGNLALLQRDPPVPTDEQTDILRDLTEESERLTRLVNDLLTLARADAGRELELDTVDVRGLVADVCRQARLLAPDREINCETPDTVTGLVNSDALRQVLLILLDNAINHAHGPVYVAVQDGDPYIRISVQDSGPGMSAELQARVFDRFYRGDISRSTPGFGLGLSIARALVQAQKGTIELESQPGQGSAFAIYLPCAPN